MYGEMNCVLLLYIIIKTGQNTQPLLSESELYCAYGILWKPY